MAAKDQEFAGWGRRLVALLLDSVLLAGVVLTTLLLAGVSLQEVNEQILHGRALVVVLIFVLPEAIYETAMIGSRTQTFGKMALGIRVVDAADRTPIGYVRAFRRWASTAFLWALFTVPGILDHLWPLRDSRRQTLHDKFAGSVVVRT